MQTVIILIHLMIVLAMVGLVLIQKSEGGGLGMGGGSGAGFMSSRGTANVLTRANGTGGSGIGRWRAQPARRWNSTAGTGGASRTIRTAGAATVEISARAGK